MHRGDDQHILQGRRESSAHAVRLLPDLKQPEQVLGPRIRTDWHAMFHRDAPQTNSVRFTGALLEEASRLSTSAAPNS